MFKDLNTDTVSCVCLEGEVPDWFHFSCDVQQGCTVATSESLFPVDWALERRPTSHGGFLGVTLGTETITDFDYADNVTLLAEMLEVLLLAVDVLKDEAHPLGL